MNITKEQTKNYNFINIDIEDFLNSNETLLVDIENTYKLSNGYKLCLWKVKQPIYTIAMGWVIFNNKDEILALFAINEVELDWDELKDNIIILYGYESRYYLNLETLKFTWK